MWNNPDLWLQFKDIKRVWAQSEKMLQLQVMKLFWAAEMSPSKPPWNNRKTKTKKAPIPCSGLSFQWAAPPFTQSLWSKPAHLPWFLFTFIPIFSPPQVLLPHCPKHTQIWPAPHLIYYNYTKTWTSSQDPWGFLQFSFPAQQTQLVMPQGCGTSTPMTQTFFGVFPWLSPHLFLGPYF